MSLCGVLQTLFSSKEARDARVRIVGQELGFLLLFSWDGAVGGLGDERKTSIALLNLESGKHQVLYTHTEVTEIVAASVNHECKMRLVPMHCSATTVTSLTTNQHVQTMIVLTQVFHVLCAQNTSYFRMTRIGSIEGSEKAHMSSQDPRSI